MKRINKIFIQMAALVAVTAMTACDDFLGEDPKTALSEKVVFNTPSDLEMNLLGCYSKMRTNALWQGDMFEGLGYASGLLHWKNDRAGNDLYVQGLNLTYFSTRSENANAFTHMYALIYSINKLIENLPDSPVDPGYKAEINGEAHLLRAIAYFTAVRMWGDVPLTVKTPKSDLEAHLPRTSYLTIYKQILDDLDIAELEMRDAERQQAVTGLTGRPNKWAATSLKAKVYVQIGSILSSPNDQPFRAAPNFEHCGIGSASDAWLKALELAEKVIDEGPYELEWSYGNLFKWSVPGDFQSKERIFVIQNTENGSTSGCYTATRSLPERPAGTAQISGTNTNWGRIRPSRFFFQKFAATYGGVPETGRGDNLTNVIVSCPDPRFDETFLYGTYYRYADTGDGTIESRNIYPRNGQVKNVTNANARGENAHPYLKKYHEPNYNASRGYADFYFLRFADMFLLAAEAAAELSNGPGDQMWNRALAHIETIHARARRSATPASAQPVWEAGRFSSKEELISAIIYERFFEMHGEGHEFFDLRRRGAQFMIDNFSVPMNAFLLEPEQNYQTDGEFNCFASVMYFDKTQPHRYPTTVGEMLKSLLCAFPANEIRVNQAISYEDQNPHYIR